MPSVLLDGQSDGDELVPAVAGSFIRVLGFDVTSDGTGTFGLDSKVGATRTSIYRTNGTLVAGGGVVRTPYDDWQLDTQSGASLVISVAGAGFKGSLTWSRHPA